MGAEQMEDRRDCKSEKGKGEGKICLIVKEAWPLFSRELLLTASLLNYEIECYLCRDSYFSLN